MIEQLAKQPILLLVVPETMLDLDHMIFLYQGTLNFLEFSIYILYRGPQTTVHKPDSTHKDSLSGPQSSFKKYTHSKPQLDRIMLEILG